MPIPYTLHRRPRPVRRARSRPACPTGPSSTAPRQARLVDCRERARPRGTRSPCSAARSTSRTAGKTYFNTTPLGRAVTGTLLVRAMHDDGVDIWGDGSTYKGNDIERFYRYGLLVNPNLRIYKPWLDAGVRRRARWPRRDERVPRRSAACRTATATEKAYSHRRQHLGRHARGQVARGAVGTSMDIVEPIMGVAHWDEPVAIAAERRHRALRRGLAGRAQRRTSSTDQVDLVIGGQRDRRPPRPRHERPDREPHHRGQEPRHLRGPGHWRCCTSPTSGWSRPSTTRARSRTTARWAAGSGRLLYEGRWFDPQSLMLREPLHALGRLGRHRRGHAAPAPRRRLHDPRHHRPEPHLRSPSACRWRRSRTPRSARSIASAS